MRPSAFGAFAWGPVRRITRVWVETEAIGPGNSSIRNSVQHPIIGMCARTAGSVVSQRLRGRVNALIAALRMFAPVRCGWAMTIARCTSSSVSLMVSCR